MEQYFKYLVTNKQKKVRKLQMAKKQQKKQI